MGQQSRDEAGSFGAAKIKNCKGKIGDFGLAFQRGDNARVGDPSYAERHEHDATDRHVKPNDGAHS